MKKLKLAGKILVFPALLLIGRFMHDPLVDPLAQGRIGQFLFAFFVAAILHGAALYLFAGQNMKSQGLCSAYYWIVLIPIVSVRAITTLYNFRLGTNLEAVKAVLYILPVVLLVHVPLHLLLGYVLLRLQRKNDKGTSCS